ncbi:MAG TPA: SpoIVB peptidase S55 domain-containing protein [Candidatus Eisenbacteria bacterium]|nr:SpoIVB peptidase S55 domain-containing protein [Candidatus Eisenbacteria bacterium]
MTKSHALKGALIAGILLAATAYVRLPLADAAPAKEAPGRGIIPPSAIFPLSDVKEGMTGVGYSVFSGTKIDTFSVTIAGVLRGYRPGFDLIMAKASGPVVDKTGIIAGMSGSPVYIDGKLVGAVSFTWSFLKEPMAGITPIDQMLSLLPRDGEKPPTTEDAFGGLGAPQSSSSDLGGAKEIATPIALAGFTTEAQQYLKPWLEERGLVASPGGANEPGGSCDDLVPGGSVAVQLIRGDWSAAALGTVTWRDKDRVLAFGHPFLAMGWMDLPLTAARVHTIMSSQQISNKIGSPTVTCGTMFADRSTGIAGRLGPSPSMIPVGVSIVGSGGRAKNYRFEVARSRYLTPTLVSAVIVNSISEVLYDAGVTTIRYGYSLYMNGGGREIRHDDVLLSSTPVAGVGDNVGQSLTLLLGDRFRPSRLDSCKVSVKVDEGIDEAALIGIRVSPANVIAGDSIDVDLSLRRSSRVVETRRVRVRIPPSAPEGDLTVRVGDANETDRWESQRAPDLFKPETFDQLADMIQNDRSSDKIYVQLYRADEGAVVGGKEISQAPGSIMNVIGSSPKSGETAETKGATLTEVAVPLGRVVRGMESATVTVIPGRR